MLNGIAHLFVDSCEGNLHDTRVKDWSKLPPLRAKYAYTFSQIDTVSKFKATLRAGAHAWPGGYPLFFITSDGAALSFESARKEFKLVAESIRDKAKDGWQVIACDVNYEDSELVCDHSGKKIESAYGPD